MFDIIGYWGVITIQLLSPIVLAALIFCNHTNKRIVALGGTRVPMFSALNRMLSGKKVGVLVGASATSLICTAFWKINVECGTGKIFSFFEWHSNIAEFLSPYLGWVFVTGALAWIYNALLKIYVKISKL